MNIELMMKAVNDLKGDLNNCYNNLNIGGFLFIDKDDGEYVISDSKEGNDTRLGYVCEVGEINKLITELSNWRPTLQKVEAVEVDGMTYEIGKLYSFKDTAAKDSAIGILLMVGDSGSNLKFLADIDDSPEWFQECKGLNYGIGKITTAPVKLIDGSAYMFMCFDRKYYGEYNKSLHRFYCGDYYHTTDDCENITRLTEAK